MLTGLRSKETPVELVMSTTTSETALQTALDCHATHLSKV